MWFFKQWRARPISNSDIKVPGNCLLTWVRSPISDCSRELTNFPVAQQNRPNRTYFNVVSWQTANGAMWLVRGWNRKCRPFVDDIYANFCSLMILAEENLSKMCCVSQWKIVLCVIKWCQPMLSIYRQSRVSADNNLLLCHRLKRLLVT